MKVIARKSTVERARENVRNLNLYVPNSTFYGALKAFDLFGSTFSYSPLVCKVEEIGHRSQRRKVAIYKKKQRDWRAIKEDIIAVAINNGIMEFATHTDFNREKYGKFRIQSARKSRK